MFVLIGLGLYKLYECRNPDNVPHTHWLLFILSLFVLLIGVGVVSNVIMNYHADHFSSHSCTQAILDSTLYFSSFLSVRLFSSQSKTTIDGS